MARALAKQPARRGQLGNRTTQRSFTPRDCSLMFSFDAAYNPIQSIVSNHFSSSNSQNVDRELAVRPLQLPANSRACIAKFHFNPQSVINCK